MFFDRLISRDSRGCAFLPLSLGLQSVELPVSHLVELDLSAHMMLARQLVHMAGCTCIGHIKPRLRERVRRPDIGERTTAAMRHPQTGELPVPSPVRIRIRSQIRAIRADPLAVGAVGSVASEKAHVIHQRILAGHPHRSHRAAC